MSDDSHARQVTEAADIPRERQLAEAFVSLADTLVADFDVLEVLDLLVRSCVDVLNSTAAGLLLGDQRGNLRVMASSSEQTHLLEVFQLQSDEGPCLECYRSGMPVTVEDLNAEASRWPRFVPEALAMGFRTVHALPMRLRSHTIGALNLFHAEGQRIPEADLPVAQALADVTTIGILQQRAIVAGNVLGEQLQTALNSRVVIEQAKGLLAAHGQLDMDAAFTKLRSYARNHNLRLSDVARDLTLGALAPDEVLSSRPARHPTR
ncbi:MAG TPA: GAF and ANTAR domain-containing protein [Mycobacteriales bacterium]|nr:GAF and ANTAR domain-containing protein [Mycobacteriales bacterium]